MNTTTHAAERPMDMQIVKAEEANVIGDAGDISSLVAARTEAFERWLPEAVEARATDDLARLAHDADLAALDQRRRGYSTVADRLTKLRIKAEAGIGIIDFAENPRLSKNDGPIVIAGRRVATIRQRSEWRRLGYAMMRGLLDEILDEASSFAAVDVQNLLRNRGVGHVPKSALAPKIRAEMRRQGVTSQRNFSQISGINLYTLQGILKGSQFVRPGFENVSWATALQAATALGIDPLTLPCAKPRRKLSVKRPSRVWLTKERKPAGGEWDEVARRFYALRAQMSSLMPNAEMRFDLAYEHLHWLQDFIHAQQAGRTISPQRHRANN